MTRLIGTTIAILLGAGLAFAQGGPGEKTPGPPTGMQGPPAVREQGPPAAREQGPGEAGMRGGAPGADVQHKPEMRIEQRGEAPPSFKEHGASTRRAIERRADDKAANAPAEKRERSTRAYRAYKGKNDGKEIGERPKTEAEDSAIDRATDKAGRAADSKDPGDRAAEKDKSVTDRERVEAPKKEDRGDKGGPLTTPGDRKEAKVELSGDKRERIAKAFRGRSDVKHRRDVGINFAVGTRLPRDWGFVPVPVAVVEIVPAYEGYLFVYVDDDYLICDPVTYEVVAIIPASGASYARDYSHGCPAHLSLTEDERDLIVRLVEDEDEDEVQVSRLTLGWSVPRNVELQTFPDPVIARASDLGSCRYFVAEDQIAIVDPEEERVVLLIDRS